jgi:hypothetical protein
MSSGALPRLVSVHMLMVIREGRLGMRNTALRMQQQQQWQKQRDNISSVTEPGCNVRLAVDS